MTKDYYKILGIEKSASQDQIKKSYKKLALKYHPDRCKNDIEKKSSETKFKEISEAYGVLSDEKKRKQYDLYGDASNSGFMFNQDFDPNEIFTKVFGANFGGFSNKSGNSDGASFMFNSMGNNSTFFSTSRSKKDPPIHKSLDLTLEELYFGCTKKFKITYKNYTSSSNFTTESQIIEINVKPGWKAGTKITFNNVGDRKIGKEPADMIFTINEISNCHFDRDKNNLIKHMYITLKESLTGFKRTINCIDGSIINIESNSIIKPDDKKIYSGKGMPIPKTPGSFGNLIIKFSIIWPDSITESQREILKSIL